MLTLDQLKDVMFKRPIYIDFTYGQDWCHLKTSLENEVCTLSIFVLNDWVPMYRLAKDQYTPLLDSPVYKSKDYITDKYYQHMANRFIKYWMGLISPLEAPVRTTVWTYCLYCKKRLTSYSSIARGFGDECNKYYKENKHGVHYHRGS